MSKPYDAATKRLIEMRPLDWVTFLGLPTGPVSLVDADLSTVSAAADRLIRVDAPMPYLLHNELESGKDTGDLPERMARYNVNAGYKTGLSVASTVFLLRRESNRPNITGTFIKPHPDGSTYLNFRYGVVRVWELEPDTLLRGGLGLLPLAPIANVAQSDLPALIQRMEARIDAEMSETDAADFWTAIYVLLGLRYDSAFNRQLLQRVRRMKESVTYQAIVEEGLEEGVRRTLRRVGTLRFGPITKTAEARIVSINSVEMLEQLVDRVLAVESWDELFPPTA